MKSILIYASKHHGNTKKLADAIATQCGVNEMDAMLCKEADLGKYDLIGFASGVAYGKYYPELLQFMEKNLPKGKKVFFLHTAGNPRENQNGAAKAISHAKNCQCVGTYFCKGFDTYGPFKLIGGIAKGHPDQEEIKKAVCFFQNICSKQGDA